MSLKWRVTCGTLTLAASLLIAGCGTTGNANVRSVNASPGLTDYNVQVGVTGIAASLPYGTVGVQPAGQYATDDSSGNYRQIGAGLSQKISIYQKPGTDLTTSTQTIVKNGYYTILNLGTYPNISLMPLTDDNTSPGAGKFKLRVVNASSTAGPVDIYLTPPGGSISGTPVVSAFQSRQVTSSYLQLAPGTYEVQVTQTGSTTAIAAAPFSPTGGEVHSVFVLDPAPGSSNFGVLVTNDPLAK
ncbi:MAG TPA: DUF4397 domain-containing protein [Acidobacteriaceae bacterium]|nr:DUF4397 domain-containing protein [Acidobacteriaceae bacterium]